MADKNINSATVVSSLNNTDYLHITTGNTFAQVSVSTLIAKAKADTLTQVEANLLDKLTDGCFIMYHQVSDGIPRAYKASVWTTQQNNGEVADGVLVVNGDRHIVVAPTEASMKWGSSATPSTAPAITGAYMSRMDALNDFDGKDKTAMITSSSLLGGDGAGYAPGFCAAYSRANSNGVGLTAGRWWLPSGGELLMMYANKQKINACLALIAGATQIVEAAYWSSSESSTTGAWNLFLNSGNFRMNNKVNDTGRVRPVSAFLS